jgi:hypothetical protein
MSELMRAELTRSVMAAVPRLSDDDLKKLAEYVSTLAPPPPEPGPGVHPLFGYMKHHENFTVTLEDIAEMRREAWANFPREFPEPEGDGQ